MAAPAWSAGDPSYQVHLPVFDGPLDLLLHLIEREELDITRVSIAQVTDQFLTYLRALQERSPEEVSSFLVVAARLIQIKSEALLPRPPEREPGEEDPAEALARQLQTYKRFKGIARWLGGRDAEGLKTYLRLAPSPKVEATLDMEGIGLEDLIQAAREAFARERHTQPIGEVVVPPQVTVREKIGQITQTLKTFGRATFNAILGRSRTRVEVVITFLALLELIKQQLVQARQESLFGEIEMHPSEGLTSYEQDGDAFDLEFDD